MRIITANVNGVRSAAEKGFFRWHGQQRADVLCLQEVRAQHAQLSASLRSPRGWSAHFASAARPGYSGVAIFARRRPDRVVSRLGWGPWDDEGRWLQVDFGALSVVSLYVPSGSSGPGRQAAKLAFLDQLYGHLARLREDGRSYVICGDLNIAHRAIDLENWRSNQKNSGFLPEERAWMDRVLGELGWVDAFRVVRPEPKLYTWWSNRGQAWAKNVGWRLDYQLVTPDLKDRVRAAEVYTRRRFSDHAPVTIDYELEP